MKITDLSKEIRDFRVRTGQCPSAIVTTREVKRALCKDAESNYQMFRDANSMPASSIKVQGIPVLEPREILLII